MRRNGQSNDQGANSPMLRWTLWIGTSWPSLHRQGSARLIGINIETDQVDNRYRHLIHCCVLGKVTRGAR